MDQRARVLSDVNCGKTIPMFREMQYFFASPIPTIVPWIYIWTFINYDIQFSIWNWPWFS